MLQQKEWNSIANHRQNCTESKLKAVEYVSCRPCLTIQPS
ncbi:hypothetical protein DAI22_07g257650 [Oryza sativa Japonica Group]|nr:hypothetical protein DAI22_07g257650 [Oryza sativa Japonica Group]